MTAWRNLAVAASPNSKEQPSLRRLRDPPYPDPDEPEPKRQRFGAFPSTLRERGVFLLRLRPSPGLWEDTPLGRLT